MLYEYRALQCSLHTVADRTRVRLSTEVWQNKGRWSRLRSNLRERPAIIKIKITIKIKI
jgi:hypothetical protein